MNHAENGTPRLRTNLPAILTSFIGREREIADTKRLLSLSRLITLTGAAGCGKTRLAVRVAVEVNVNYPDGAHFVDFAQIADPTMIPQAVAKTLHIAEQPSRLPIESLLDALPTRRLLLVLDNCEHVQRACAQLARDLLTLPHVCIIATSREPLAIAGEMLFPVPPMSLPSMGTSIDETGRSEAVRLFVERARAILPAFEVNADNVMATVSICRKLDGIPLAIELASVLVNVLTVEQIAAKLNDQFEILTAPSHITHSHHDTLRASLDWSYDLLSPAEQTLLRRLTVFAGGCSLASIETICSGGSIGHGQVFGLLSSLVKKSLVVANTLRRSEAYYSLLEIIRQYAQERLVTTGEWPVLKDRHLQYFLQVVEETEPKLLGQYQELWLDWLEGELANIRMALSWSLESEHIEVGLRIAIGLYQFWTIRDYAEEGFGWIERLLAEADRSVALGVRANALAYAMTLAGFRGNTEAIKKYGLDAAALAEGADGVDGEALRWVLAGQYYAARIAGDHQTEYALAKRLIQLHRESGTLYDLAIALTIYSFSAMSVGQYDDARTMLDEGLPLLRELGNRYRIAMALNFSGDLARLEGNYAQARLAYEESIALLREIDAVRDLASALHNLGHACLRLGDVEHAHVFFGESMTIHQTQGNASGMTECLIGFAALAVVCGLPAAGVRLLTALVTIGGEHAATAWAATNMEYEHYLALARAGLTKAEYEIEQTTGRGLSLEQAIEYARNVALQAIALEKTSKPPDELTLREREITALIAQAKSNNEIADELVISKRTVEKHIANIRSKLGFTKRSEIVRWMIENNPQARDE